MSIHSSLRSGKSATGSARNVLKRHERIRHLASQGLWANGHTAFGLPKIKQTKIRARKAAGKEKEETAGSTAEKTATPPSANP